MKKLIAATMVAMAAICAKADTWKDTSTGYTWTYTVSGGTARIYDDYSHSTAVSPLPTGALNIPFWLGDKRVTSIGYKALYGCDGLTSITIPSSVTNIGSYAFSGCRGLENVTIPGNVTSIGSYAFSGCRGLENVTIPRNVTSIGSYAFSDCSGLTSVTILDSMTRKSIGDRAFKGCISLSSVTIPDSVTYVGYCAFDDCNAALYDTATIPGVKLVDGWAIGNTGSLSGSLNLTGVRGIGYSAFYGCSGLTSVTIGDGVTSIGDWAFGFSRLTSVTIPDSVTSIGTNAFKACSSLKDVIVPQCVCTNRMSYVFPDAYQSITNVIISDGVTSIGPRAFWRCSSLASVMIPDSVTSIGEHAFDSCTGLTSVVVSASVKNIEPWAFYTCRGLRSITFEGNAPEIGSGVFSGIASDGCAYVRRDSTGWGVHIPGTWKGITIDYLPEIADQYIVIDLSGGANATSYAVSYLSNVPIGGWTDQYKTTKLVLRKIEPGSFNMIQGGTNVSTTLTKPYYIGVFEVTQRQWELVMGNNPCYSTSYGKGDAYPVHYVSWNMIRGVSSTYDWPTSTNVDPDSFVGRIQSRTKLNFDLPTEAQWEYSCRAGTTTTYSYGNDADGSYMWYSGNSDSTSHTVGTKLPNDWGLYDMHGNIWEWCLDWYDGTLMGGNDPAGSSIGSGRVARGDSWGYDAGYCTSADRGSVIPSYVDYYFGFRLVRTLSDIVETNDIALAQVDVDCSVVTYSGSAFTPPIQSATWGGNALVEGTDYTLAYADNVNAGIATITLIGTNLYNGTYTTNFTIRPRPLTQGMVGAIGNHPYTGKAQTPKPTVTDVERGVTLREDVEYTLSYANNTALGDGVVTVTGKGNYTGSIARMFVIEPSTGSELEECFGGAGKAESDGVGGWIVTLTNDVNSADLPIDIPDDIGRVTIDLNGHDLLGANGEDGAVFDERVLPGGDGKSALRIVSKAGDGAPTVLSVITTGGDALVKGGDGGAGNPGGNGAPAIKVTDDAQDGVLINIGAGVTVRGGGEDVPAIIGEIGVNEGAIIMPAAKVEVTLKVGEYFYAKLAELGYEVPTDGKTAYTVKAYGLPAGLKLVGSKAVTKKVGKKTVVVTPANVEWWIEGVPTAAMDFFENPPYLLITANGTTVTEPLPIEVVPQEVTELEDLALGQTVNEQFYLSGVTNGWTVSGLPTGLKYTAKLLTEKWKAGKKTMIVTNALPYSVYGKTTKAGLFTITAKKKVNGSYETLKYRVLVTPAAVDTSRFGEELTNITTMAYVPVTWDLVNGGEWDGGHAGRVTLPGISAIGGVKVAKVSGLPTGLTFAAADTYKDKKKTQVKQYGQTIVGTPTKPGTYVVTFTKNVKSGKKTVAKTAQILWTVIANDTELELGFNKKGGVIESGVVGLKYGDLLAFTATDGATVTASGLPKGITLVRLDGGNWGFKGYTTKAGTYLVTVKATIKGKTLTQRVALVVDGLPTWAKGTFNGYVWGTGNGEWGTGGTNGLATVTVSSVGKISGKFSENGTNWTLSAACYTGNGEWGTGNGESSSAKATEDKRGTAFTCSNVVAKYSYKVKSGKKMVTKTLTRTFSLIVSDGELGGVATMTETGGSQLVATEIEAWQNLWGRADYKAVGKKLFTTKSGKKTLAYRTFTVDVYTNDVGEAAFIQKGADVDKTGLTYFITLSLKVTTAGAVTATLTYDTGKKDKKTKKAVYYKPTCSTVVIPTSAADADQFTCEVPLYFAPSAANNFPGFAAAAPL